MAPLIDPRRRTVTRLVFWGFLAVALFYLLAEHRAHFLGVFPFLLVLACPLMHLFMHHGHGAHEHGSGDSAPQVSGPSTPDHSAHHSS